MPEITYDDMTDQMREIYEADEVLSLHPLSNAAPGTLGACILGLVRRGLWEVKEIRYDEYGREKWTSYGSKVY